LRIRVTRQPEGVIDGIDLSRLIEGHIYDVGTSIGNLLLASRWAVPVDETAPALVVPLDHPVAREILQQPLDRADDRSARRRRLQKRR
jgi:hypothetical protein